MSMELADDVRAIRDYIDEHGWTQHRFVDPNTGSVCLTGARQKAVHDPKRSIALGKHLQDLIKQNYGFPHGLVAMFNDSVLKSKQECLDFLDKAAIAAEEKA